MSDWQQQAWEWEQKVEQLQSDLEACRAVSVALQTQVAQLQRERDEYKEELDLFDESIHDRKARFIEFKKEIEQLQHERDDALALLSEKGDLASQAYFPQIQQLRHELSEAREEALANLNQAHLNALDVLRYHKTIEDALDIPPVTSCPEMVAMRVILREGIK